MTAPAQRGTTVISDKAVRKIAERAAREALPGPLAGAVSGSATVRGRRAAVALRVALPYPVPLSATTCRLQEHVAGRSRALTGLDVSRPRLTVTRLAPAASLPSAARASEDLPARRPPRRWWAQRRTPISVLMVVAATACAAVTADVIRVHVTHHRAAAWRAHGMNWLANHGPGEEAVVAAGVLVALLGVWTLVLALTPGNRHKMTLRMPVDGSSAAVDRATVAALIRDAVGEVPGIDRVSVRIRRRRVRARCHLAFGDRDTAQDQAAAAARHALDGCRLTRPPRLKVSVVPEATWQPPQAGDATPQSPPTEPSGLTTARDEP